MNSRFTSVVRFFLLVAVGFSICISSQPALASKSQTGRLVVQRSPTFGSKTYLQLWIDGNKVANIGPGQGYDEIDSGRTSRFGRELHPQNTAPANLNASGSASGRDVCIHSHSRIRSRGEFSAVKSYSSIKERSPA